MLAMDKNAVDTSETPHRSSIPVAKPWLGPEEAEAAAAVVASGWVAQGPKVEEFERSFSQSIGCNEAVAVSSGTTALHLAMILLGVGPGDEVVVPSLSFIATANAARYVGATPVFADVDPKTHNVTAETIGQALSTKTKAVIVAHQMGVPADVDTIRGLAAERDLAVVEDAACAIGSTYKGKMVGWDADLATFSFHPRKLLTTGEGGMLGSASPADAARARRLRDHGINVSASDRHRSRTAVVETYLETGYNYRMTDMQAAIGLVQLDKLEQLLTRRRTLAARYTDSLADLDVTVVSDPPYGTTNYQSYWLLLPDDSPIGRDELLARLVKDGISAKRGVMASHREPAFSDLPMTHLPETERLADQSLILPLYHDLSRADQDFVITRLRKHLGVGER